MPGDTAVDVLVVPPVPALLPEHRSLIDPVADLRAAVEAGVRQLLAAGTGITVIGDPVTAPIAAHLLGAPTDVDREVPAGTSAVLVLGSGSAKRTERAPGHLDDRAEAFDADLGKALLAADGRALADLDAAVGAELWAEVEPLIAVGRFMVASGLTWTAEIGYDDAPYGVQYWVAHLRGTSR